MASIGSTRAVAPHGRASPISWSLRPAFSGTVMCGPIGVVNLNNSSACLAVDSLLPVRRIGRSFDCPECDTPAGL